MRSCSRSLAGVCATLRLGFGRRERRGRCLETAETAEPAAGGQGEGGAQDHRRSPKAAAFPSVLPSRNPYHLSHSFLERALV